MECATGFPDIIFSLSLSTEGCFFVVASSSLIDGFADCELMRLVIRSDHLAKGMRKRREFHERYINTDLIVLVIFHSYIYLYTE